MRNEHARKPAFVELESVDFRNHIEWRTLSPSVDYELEFLRLIRDRLDVKVESPETKPAWRILVLHAEGTDFVDIMCEWGHAHIDGISVKILHEALLRKLNNGDEARPSIFKDRVLTIPPEKRRDLLPPLHTLCDFPLTTRWAVTTLWKEVKLPVLSGNSDLLANWAPIQLRPYVTQYRHFSLDNDILQKVLVACREHKTTLTGLLQALAMFSLAMRLSPEKARGFIGTTVVNLRPIMSSKFLQSHNIDPNNTMANFVTVVDHEYDAELVANIRARANESSGQETHNRMATLEEFLWPTAEKVRGDLQRKLDEGTKNDQMGLLKFVPDFRLLLKDWAKKPRVTSIAVTNLGVIDGNPSNASATETEGELRGKWTIDRAVFSVSPEVHYAAFVICPLAVKGKELYVSCDWQDAAMDMTLAEGIVADLESWLRYFGR
ncbi:hypothetical protein F4820DRAFT_419489 [Hypoxylon rubiginosum]|uniref:Uncharacterized protein n=1 Tax=Hypoxylon rubiginosum TaxID=110542 RepID=A0ACB9Z343_9PEZI|nr:hypothetical protein F4820DRAFT_419489 [Hypoxylon rubiginosum]